MTGLIIIALLATATIAAASSPDEEQRAAALPPKTATLDAAMTDLEVLVARGCIASVEEWEADLAPGARVAGERAAMILEKLAGLFTPVGSVQEAIAELVARRMISTPESWRRLAVKGRTCAGDDLAMVVSRVVSRFWQPIPTPHSFAARPLETLNPLDVKEHYDVIIAGAGTGGCGAAIQAARMGCSVLLVEQTDLVGGQAFAAGVTSMDEGKPFIRDRGLYRELCGLIQAYYEPLGVDFVTAYQRTTPAAEPRVGRELLLRMLGDARGAGTLDLALRTGVTDVKQQGNTIVGVTIACPDGPEQVTRKIACGVLIDATEWGDVLPLTGARYRAGGSTSDKVDPRKQIQNLTWTAVVKQYPAGVPSELRLTTPPPDYDAFLPEFRASLALGDPGELGPSPPGEPWNWRRFIEYRGMPDSTRKERHNGITRTHLNYNNDFPVRVADLEDPECRIQTCQKAVLKTLCLLHYMQTELGHDDWSVANDEEYDTPFNRSQVETLIASRPEVAAYRDVLRHFPIMPYVRESRRIVGLHTLTAREIERRPGTPTQFPDTVAVGDYAVDLHGSMKPELLEPEFDRIEDIPRKFGERGLGPFAIPFRSFIPEKIDGLLAAEKNISQSRLANGATRLQPSTLNMGQAAGAIAALSIKQKTPPRALDPADVQQVLLEAGCPLTLLPVASAPGSDDWIMQQRQALRDSQPISRAP